MSTTAVDANNEFNREKRAEFLRLASQVEELSKALESLNIPVTTQLKPKEPSSIDPFESELLHSLKEGIQAVHDNIEKGDRAIVEKIRTFQKKCAAIYEIKKTHKVTLETLKEAHGRDVSYKIMNGPEKIEENLKIIVEIIDNLINETDMVLKWISKPNLFLNRNAFVCFYLARFQEFNKQMLSATNSTEELHSSLKKMVDALLKEEKKMMMDFFREFGEVLDVWSRNLLQRCKVYFPSSLQARMEEKLSNDKFIEINQKYYMGIQKSIDILSEKYQRDMVPFEAAFNNREEFDKFAKLYISLFKLQVLAAEECISSLAPDENTFLRFKALHAFETACAKLYEVGNAKLKRTLTFLQTKKTESEKKKAVEIIREVIEKEHTYAEVALQEKRIQKAKEQARREQAKAEREKIEKVLLIQKKNEEEANQAKINKDKIKIPIVAAMKNLRGDQRKLMEDILRDKNLHREVSEQIFEKLIGSLGLSLHENTKGSGGKSITIHTETISYHHWKGDNPGTLDGTFIKNFKKALEKLGISITDLPKKARRSPKPLQ